MNVMNRKMFANRDARQRLANMGGIMTSSPELMQAAQMFAPGGQVGSPTAQKVKTVNKSGFIYDVYSDGRVVPRDGTVPLDPRNTVQAALIQDIIALPGVQETLTQQPIAPEYTMDQSGGILSAAPVQIRGADTPNAKQLADMIQSGSSVVPGANIPGPSETYEIDPNAALEAGKAITESIDNEMGSTTQDMALQSIMDRADGLTGKEKANASLEALIATNQMEDLDSQLANQLLPPKTIMQSMIDSGELKSPSTIEDKPGTLMDDVARLGLNVKNIVAAGGLSNYKKAAPVSETGTATSQEKKPYVSPIITRIKKAVSGNDAEETADAREAGIDQPGSLKKNDVEKNKKPYVSPIITRFKEIFSGGDDGDEEAAANREAGIAQPNALVQVEAIATNPNSSPDKRSKDTSETVLSGFGIKNVDNMSTKQRVKAYQDMFKEFLGGDDKDADEEKWHNLAMIGFAIAAGESPSALSNIANGLLEGSKVMKSDRAADRKRDDSITSMAIEQVFSEKAAERDAQLRRDIAAAKGGSGAREYRSPIDAYDNALTSYTEMLKEPRFAASVLSEGGLKRSDPGASAYLKQWVNTSALERVQNIYPDEELKQYGYDRAKSTETTKSYFEANRPKNANAIYTFGGVTYENDDEGNPISQ